MDQETLFEITEIFLDRFFVNADFPRHIARLYYRSHFTDQDLEQKLQLIDFFDAEDPRDIILDRFFVNRIGQILPGQYSIAFFDDFRKLTVPEVLFEFFFHIRAILQEKLFSRWHIRRFHIERDGGGPICHEHLFFDVLQFQIFFEAQYRQRKFINPASQTFRSLLAQE